MTVAKKSEEPQVSILIPSYNRAHLLPRALQSITTQDFEDLEIIVVDDGSKDDTAEFLANEAMKNPKLRYVIHPENRGEAAARNTAIHNAKGRYIAFLDSDDEWLPGKLSVQYKYLQENETYDGVITNVWIVENNVRRLGDGWHLKKPISLYNILTLGCALNFSLTIFMKRESALASAPYDETLKLFVDVDWIANYLVDNKVHFLNEPYAVYHKAPARSGEAVESAANEFVKKNEALIRSLGKKGDRHARSAFVWTYAASYHADKKYLHFLFAACRSIFIYPAFPMHRYIDIIDILTLRTPYRVSKFIKQRMK